MKPVHRKRHYSLEYLVDLACKKRFYIVIPLIIATAAGLALSLILPKIYEAGTLILVEPKRVPGEYVRAIVPQDIRSRIGTITQQIMSRSNLERVIDQFQLFSDPKHHDMFMEDKVAVLRDQISVRVSRTGSGAEAFLINYRGKSPETVMQVTNTLAKLFIESNLQVREEQAQGTSNFLDDELENMRKKLGSIEADLQSYRQRYMGELPEQLDSNLKMLETFRIQLEERKERMRNERNRLVASDNEIEQLRVGMERSRKDVTAAGSRDPEIQAISKLDELREELKTLQSMYTDQHPNVIRLKSRIERMEKEPPAKIDSTKAKAEAAAPQSADTSATRILAERMRQRAAILSSISSMQDDINKIDGQIKEYQRRIERTPKREEEMLALKRDYQNIQEAYKSLLARKIEADMAVNMERKKKGEEFQILDYAKTPEKPVSPDLKRIFLLTLVLGLFVGLSLALATDVMDQTVRGIDDVADDEIPVLGTIPECCTPQLIRHGVIRKIATALSISAVCVLTAVFAYIAVTG